MKPGLKELGVSGIKWSALSAVFGTAIQLVQLIVLARLLQPEDFGLMATAMVVIGFSQAFADMGLSNAIVQRKSITQGQLSSLYWINVLAGAVVFALIALLSQAIAGFYHEPRLGPILVLAGLTIFIHSFAQQFQSLLQKELRFNRIVIVELLTKLLAVTTSVWLALQDFGVYSLVYAAVLSAFASAFLLFLMSVRDHRPTCHFRLDEARGFLGFGAYQMGEKTVNYFSAQIDKVLIGRILGMEALGIYNLAWQLIIFPLAKINPVVSRVAMPVYSKLQDDRRRLAYYYERSLRALAIITVPLLVFLGFFSFETIRLVYGPRWDAAVQILPFLAAVGILKVVANPGGAVVLALGKPKIAFWWNVAWVPLVLAAVPLALGIWPHLAAVPIALLIISLLTAWVWHYLLYTLIHYDRVSLLCELGKILAAAILAGAIARYCLDLTALEQPLLRFFAAGGLYACIYALLIFPLEIRFLRQLWTLR